MSTDNKNLSPDLVAKRDLFFRRAKDELGVTLEQTSGWRTPAEDLAAYVGWKGSEAGYPRRNGHLTGIAFDCMITDINGDGVRRKPHEQCWKLGEECGLRAGGIRFGDAVHFDLGYDACIKAGYEFYAGVVQPWVTDLT